ncbi:MAG: M56 family metallopeptidase [Anaerolineae bacterium]|nr:M56 family metallopeptidase [Gemmatimonadaceae bacterium]
MSARFGETFSLHWHAPRRATLLAICSLLILGTGPVFGHHVNGLGTTEALSGIDHIGALCVTALHMLLLPVHKFFHVLIVGGVVYALYDRLRAWRSAGISLASLEQRQPSSREVFGRCALHAGVNLARIRVVRDLANPAFTAGLVSPCIYLAEELPRRLTESQLTAVMAHERAHLDRRDPLRLFLLRTLACTLFWIPALRKLADDVADEAEIRADDHAALGQPLVLASAILALASWRTDLPAPQLSVGFQRNDLLERRIRRLAGEDIGIRSHVTRRSILSAAFALSLVWTSGAVVAHPLPAVGHHGTRDLHCDHERESALVHLFCLGSPFVRFGAADCPHGAPRP